jgi:hypothetical protein
LMIFLGIFPVYLLSYIDYSVHYNFLEIFN